MTSNDSTRLLDCLLALRSRDDSSPLDPTPWYGNKFLEKQSPNELGDAVEALRRLLLHIRRADKQSSSDAEGSWQTVFTCGSRTKVLPKRQIPNPYPINVKHALSLVEAFQASLREAKTVDNYQWDGFENNAGLLTTRTRKVFALPSCLILHLQRFDYDRGLGRVVQAECHPTLQVEPTFRTEDLGLLDLAVHYTYSLTGAILHIKSGENCDQIEEDGHYVSLVLWSSEWFAVDDEHTFSVQCSQVLSWIQGGNWEGVDGDQGLATGVLLVFDSSREDTEALWRAEMDKDRSAGWIGRRINIRWKSGQYFTGRITAFNTETNKHTVLYDDGDIREYDLNKKTYAWM